jgi:hypothetical protein
MTDTQALRDMLAAATKGPWELTERHDYYEILGPRDRADWYGRKGVWAVAYADTDREDQEANAALIVAAVNAMPGLLDEVEGLRAALRAMVDEKCDYMCRNLLGDPEQQHTIKQARAALGGRDDQ